MRTYLWSVSYTAEGAQGLLREGGSSRRKAIEELANGLGGQIHAWYYAFGEYDLYVIASLPSDVEATALSMTVAASGAVRIDTTPLMTTEQLDEAARVSINYRAPGA
jgi:uncharacterized protein with GYD domain